MPKDFWNLPVNPVWRVPGFMKGGKADNERSKPVFIAPCPRIHKHLNFSSTVSTLLKIFVRSRRDWEKKCQIGIRHSPSTNRYGFAKIVAFCLCPFCIVMPTSGERGGGSFSGGKGGWIGSVKWWWMMMRWITFYILYTMAFWGLEDDTVLIFGFTFCSWTLLAPCMLYFETDGS